MIDDNRLEAVCGSHWPRKQKKNQVLENYGQLPRDLCLLLGGEVINSMKDVTHFEF